MLNANWLTTWTDAKCNLNFWNIVILLCKIQINSDSRPRWIFHKFGVERKKNEPKQDNAQNHLIAPAEVIFGLVYKIHAVNCNDEWGKCHTDNNRFNRKQEFISGHRSTLLTWLFIEQVTKKIKIDS